MTGKTAPQTLPTLKIERVFNASPERLWTYWTDPTKFARWFNPAPGIALVIHEFDVRVGGRVRFDMPQPDGNKNPQEGVFHVLDPYREIVSGEPDKSFLIRVRFEPEGKKTRMTVEATGVPAEYLEGATKGWNAGFDKLARELSAGGRRTFEPKVTVERVFKATPERLWAMWTTREGLEKWYWPEGLVARVVHLDVRPGGRFEIAAEGLPHTSRGTYTEVVPHKRLCSVAEIDFIQGVEPYLREDEIEFQAVPSGTKLLFTSTNLHNDEWQKLSLQGWASSMNKLAKALDESERPTAGAAPNARGFTIERTFKAPPERVWKMWTTKEGLEKWFGKEGWTTKVTKLDVRVCGEYEITISDGQQTFRNYGVYILADPPRHLAYIWHYDIYLGPNDKPYDVPIDILFEAVPEGTKMTFTQGPLAAPQWTEGSRQGVLATFERLAKEFEE